MSDKVIRDGKVAVIISPGFGAGWYSWNEDARLLSDPQLVAAVEANDRAAVEQRAKEIEPDGYWGASHDLMIEWVPVGTIFRIHEYDGSETLTPQNDDDWIVA